MRPSSATTGVRPPSRVHRAFRVLVAGGVGLCVLFLASVAVAQPYGYSVNSRGNLPDSNDVNALWKINLADGSAERVSEQGLPTGFLDLEALALNPNGEMYGADDDLKTLVRVSTVTGIASAVGGTTINMGRPLGENMDFGMAFDCDGRAFVVSDVEQSLFTADTNTGVLSLVGEAGSLGAPITDLAIFGSYVFGIGVGLDGQGNALAPNLYRLDLEAVSAELIGPLGPQASAYNNAGLSFDESGNLWAVTDRRQVGGQDHPSEVLQINPQTGEATRIATTSIVGLESLAVAPPQGCELPAVPMPRDGFPIPVNHPLALALLGLLVLALGGSMIRFGVRG